MKNYAKAIELDGKVQLVFNLPKDAIRKDDQFVEQVDGDSEATVERFEKKYGVRCVERMLPQVVAQLKDITDLPKDYENPRYYGWFLQV